MPVMTDAKKTKIAAETVKPISKTSKTKTSKTKVAKSPKAKIKTKPQGDVRLTHPDRIYWVDVGVTKQDLADYYRLAWDWMAPLVIDRPLALVRCPDGTKGQCFFQKHASAGLSEKNLRTVTDSNKRQIIAVESLEGLLSLV